MFGWLTRLFAAAVVASAVLIAPTAAFACGGGTSAVNVYKECLPSGGGGKPAKGSASQGHHTSSSPKSRISKSAAKVLHTAHRDDRQALHRLLASAGPPLPKTTQTGSANAPTALGSAFDLGSGPTALLIVLAGTALLLLGGGGMRAWRARNRV